MQSIASKPLYVVREKDNLSKKLIEFAGTKHLEKKILRKIEGEWVGVSYADFYNEVRVVATMLINAGIEPGDRVALMGPTSYEWTLIHFGIMFAGAITVPIYETASKEQADWILKDSSAKAMFAHTNEYAALAIDARERFGFLSHIWCIEDGSFATSFRGVEWREDVEIAERCAQLTSESCLAIVYTSGTTGRPKGCITTHRQMIAQLENNRRSMTGMLKADEYGPARSLLFLPTAHIFGLFALHFFFHNEVIIGHSENIKNLVHDIQDFKPTSIVAVPRVFQKIYVAAEQKAFQSGKGKIFHYATKIAGKYSKAMQNDGVTIVQSVLFTIFNVLVYRKILDQLGGRVTWSICGGAPLGERLGHFYRGIGINIVEGWGLTETCGPVTGNTELCPYGIRMGSTGLPVASMQLRIAETGEIEVEGDCVFAGYYNNQEATDEVMTEDGWFKTGDIGQLDDDGYLYITGRSKDLLVTAGGKNIAPAPMEEHLKTHSLINEALVIGDGQRFVAALITLNEEVLRSWCNTREKPELTIEQAMTDPDVHDSIQRAIDGVNERVSHAEGIKTFRILPQDFSVEDGTLTPSLKAIRRRILDKYHAQVEDIYGKPDSI